MRKWHRPHRAGFLFGGPLRILATATDPTEPIGTVADVGTDGDGNAVVVLVALAPEDRRWVPVDGTGLV